MNKLGCKRHMREKSLSTRSEIVQENFKHKCAYCTRTVRHPCSRKSLARICTRREEPAQ